MFIGIQINVTIIPFPSPFTQSFWGKGAGNPTFFKKGVSPAKKIKIKNKTKTNS